MIHEVRERIYFADAKSNQTTLTLFDLILKKFIIISVFSFFLGTHDKDVPMSERENECPINCHN